MPCHPERLYETLTVTYFAFRVSCMVVYRCRRGTLASCFFTLSTPGSVWPVICEDKTTHTWSDGKGEDHTLQQCVCSTPPHQIRLYHHKSMLFTTFLTENSSQEIVKLFYDPCLFIPIVSIILAQNCCRLWYGWKKTTCLLEESTSNWRNGGSSRLVVLFMSDGKKEREILTPMLRQCSWSANATGILRLWSSNFSVWWLLAFSTIEVQQPMRSSE